MERVVEVKPTRVHLMCDLCPDIEMKSDGVFASNPPKYDHRCPNCGCQQITREKYPLIRWTEINDSFSHF